MSEPTINDKSHFKISLPMALQALGIIGILVFGYRDLESRIRILEHKAENNTSDMRQDILINTIESEIGGMNDDLEYIKRIMYGENNE